jgi:hypothetical protein
MMASSNNFGGTMTMPPLMYPQTYYFASTAPHYGGYNHMLAHSAQPSSFLVSPRTAHAPLVW